MRIVEFFFPTLCGDDPWLKTVLTKTSKLTFLKTIMRLADETG